jgi:hypothetical protein
VYITYLHTHDYSDSLVTAIKPTAKYRFHTANILSYIQKKLQKFCIFSRSVTIHNSRNLCRAQVQLLSLLPQKFVFRRVGITDSMKLKVWATGSFRWHDIHNKFHHSPSSGSRVASCQRRHTWPVFFALITYTPCQDRIKMKRNWTHFVIIIFVQGAELCLLQIKYQVHFRENRWLKCWDVRLVLSLVEISPVSSVHLLI